MVSISEIMLFAIADVCTLLSVSQNTMSLIEMTVIRYTKTWMAWLIWRKFTVVLYDLNIPLSLTSEVYEAIVRPVLRYGSECRAMKTNSKMMIGTTEVRMLLEIAAVSRQNHVCETKTFYISHCST